MGMQQLSRIGFMGTHHQVSRLFLTDIMHGMLPGEMQ